MLVITSIILRLISYIKMLNWPRHVEFLKHGLIKISISITRIDKSGVGFKTKYWSHPYRSNNFETHLCVFYFLSFFLEISKTIKAYCHNNNILLFSPSIDVCFTFATTIILRSSFVISDHRCLGLVLSLVSILLFSPVFQQIFSIYFWLILFRFSSWLLQYWLHYLNCCIFHLS